MEETIRDFKREAPGRRRNSVSTINAATAAIRRLEEKSFTAPLLEFRGASSYELERPPPACLIEKVQDRLAQKQNTIAPVRLEILAVGSLE